MPNKTLPLILGAIKKWEGIVEGTIEDEGRKNCPLCQKYWKGTGWNECESCPIAEYEKPYCYNTPYIEWYVLLNNEIHRYANTHARIEAALLELTFLYFIYYAEGGEQL